MAQVPVGDQSPITNFEAYFTASEAFPAFEKLCLSAKKGIRGCFRVFDPSTALHSEEARAHGETWFDLLLHLLNKGVEIDLSISDFDPIIATDDHRRSWQAARQLAALNELSTGAKLTFAIVMHPARVGYVPRRVLHGKTAEVLEQNDVDPLTPGLEGLDPSDDLPMVPATHHQKLAVIDDEALYIGGLDLNNRRFDTVSHDQPSDGTWQDIQAIARGPVVRAAATHLRRFRSVTEAREEAPPQAPGFLRTLSTKRSQDLIHIAPKPLVNEIEQAHLDAVARCVGLIYLETQFFRHKPLAEAIVKAAQKHDALGCILVLPAAPEDVAFEGNEAEDAQLGAQIQMEALEILGDGLGERLALASPAQARPAQDEPDAAILHGAPLIYVHSKLSLFGQDEAILSSANLNGRSFQWDTEAGLHLTERAHVAPLWPRVFEHWLGDDAPDPLGQPRAVVEQINASLRQARATLPQDRNHFLLPFDPEAQAQLAKPLPFVPDEMV